MSDELPFLKFTLRSSSYSSFGDSYRGDLVLMASLPSDQHSLWQDVVNELQANGLSLFAVGDFNSSVVAVLQSRHKEALEGAGEKLRQAEEEIARLKVDAAFLRQENANLRVDLLAQRTKLGLPENK